MKKNMKSILVGAVMALVSVAGAQAVQINGAISFSGGVMHFRGPAGMNTDLTNAVGVNTYDTSVVAFSFGDFASEGVATGNAAVFAPNWVWLTPQPTLWSVGGFEFDLNSGIAVVKAATSVTVTGNGVVRHASYEDTPATFVFTANDIRGARSFSASTGTGTVSVPDGGASVALLGLSLVGLQILRRKMRQVA